MTGLITNMNYIPENAESTIVEVVEIENQEITRMGGRFIVGGPK